LVRVLLLEFFDSQDIRYGVGLTKIENVRPANFQNCKPIPLEKFYDHRLRFGALEVIANSIATAADLCLTIKTADNFADYIR